MKEELIAPCGMNCNICSGYLACKSDVKSAGIRMPYCAGCRPRDKKCAFLKKRCSLLLESKLEYCYECGDFPCSNLQKLDTRYRRDFRMSMIENLLFIRSNGIDAFLEAERDKWKCPDCGSSICCHNGICFECSKDKLAQKKNLYRWEDD